MQIRIFDNEKKVAKAAAALFAGQLLQKPNSVLGLATGSSPLPLYGELIALYEAGIIDFAEAISFNLDEYVDLSGDHPASYHAFMEENLFSKINIKKENTHVPSGDAKDVQAACRQYDMAVAAAGGIDMQLLGIGRNGHIGFNEPGDKLHAGCHVTPLAESTIRDNRRFFSSEAEVPREAITMGVGGIMQAKTVVLIATGEGKAQAVRDSVLGPITPSVPASMLQGHRNTIFLLDREAAAGL